MKEEQKNLYNCPYCKDTTWIVEVVKGARRCKCFEIEMIKEQWKASGLNINDSDKTFKSYEVFNNTTKELKATATNYYLRFKNIEKTSNNSILL